MRIGIIGGTGQLGSAIAIALLETRTVLPETLWIANRSGSLGPLDRWSEIRTTTAPSDLAEVCEVIVLAVPPDQARDLRLSAPNALILSVMAGVTLEDLSVISGSQRVVRAMSSPAAAYRLAYSPWIAMAQLSDADEALVSKLLGACGATDKVASEDHIDRFTALTGPVPGFVAAFAEAMILHATRRGIPGDIADRAIRQLFLSAGTMMSLDEKSPSAHVQEMIDYAGTTAAGLTALRNGPLNAAVDDALEAAYQRTKSI
ncbi:MAG: NAD(P)-binding domain-containing protein [Silicimonas sp.]|nr:NAD(P)-binding domain-containing protein [Silicimonas sp.]NND21026.1 NAD(P)-binding domain-containing protein [Silicimonas sp.]NNL71970.1 NAD(P)-binding domain-containing protein [Silicimonas sp.]